MTVVRLKGLKRYRHPKTGLWYTYHRATGMRIKAEPGTPAFLAEVAALNAGLAPKQPAPGTVGMVVKAYRRSPAWTDLRDATRLSYDRAFAAIEGLADMPLIEISRPFMVGLQERVFEKRGRWMANYVVTVVSILCEYAVDRGWLKANPADGVKRLKRSQDAPRANRPWTRAESRVVLEHVPDHLRVPIALAMFTGLRKSDVLTVKKDAVSDHGVIRVKTSKRGVYVSVPMHPDLLSVLARAPVHEAATIAATMAGQAWTVSGFNSTFAKAIGRLEERGLIEPGLTMHGLRHALGTRLREAGAEMDDIRRILGQKTLAMAQHYSETADRSEHARGLIAKLDMTGDNGALLSTQRQKVSTPKNDRS